MRLLIASVTVLAACGSSGHGAGGAGGTGGGAGRGVGVSPDTGDAQVITDAAATADAADAGLTFSCQLTPDGGGPAACIQLDPGPSDASSPCAVDGAGPVMTGACPRATSSGGCHVARDATSGHTVWWYAPLGAGAVLSLCEMMGDSYVSP